MITLKQHLRSQIRRGGSAATVMFQTSTPSRGFYFHLDQNQKNLDFPLNVGYNDNFKYHS